MADDNIRPITPTTKILEPEERNRIERETKFLAVVWEALTGNYNDLRREARILRAFREAIDEVRRNG